MCAYENGFRHYHHHHHHLHRQILHITHTHTQITYKYMMCIHRELMCAHVCVVMCIVYCVVFVAKAKWDNKRPVRECVVELLLDIVTICWIVWFWKKSHENKRHGYMSLLKNISISLFHIFTPSIYLRRVPFLFCLFLRQ